MNTLKQVGDGYRGIWYAVQPSNDEYAYKYSGGLGTYCAKHQPFAVHCPEANRTFFCYGGTTGGRPNRPSTSPTGRATCGGCRAG